MMAIHDALKSWNLDVYLVPEAATLLINGGASFADADSKRRIVLQTQLMKVQMHLEESFHQIAKSRGTPAVLLCDRGGMDSAAYLSKEEWERILEVNQWTVEEHLREGRYDHVSHLVTAADGAEEFYTTANNSARRETPEQAREIDRRLREAWIGHPNIAIIDNSSDFQKKVSSSSSSILRFFSLLSFSLHSFSISSFNHSKHFQRWNVLCLSSLVQSAFLTPIASRRGS